MHTGIAGPSCHPHRRPRSRQRRRRVECLVPHLHHAAATDFQNGVFCSHRRRHRPHRQNLDA